MERFSGEFKKKLGDHFISFLLDSNLSRHYFNDPTLRHSYITRKLIHLLTSLWKDLGGSGGVICREAYEETLVYAKKYWARHLACSRRGNEEILLALKRYVVDLELGFFDLVRTINWLKVRTSIISTFNT
jgi:hypothetical protein